MQHLLHTQYGEMGKEGAACGQIGNEVAVTILHFTYVTRAQSLSLFKVNWIGYLSRERMSLPTRVHSSKCIPLVT